MLKTRQEIQAMRQGGKILGNILKALSQLVKPGVSTAELNKLAEELIKQTGAGPAFKNYQLSGLPPFPCALCTSINEEVVHGLSVPGRILKERDIVGLDLGIKFKGLFLDAAVTVGVGNLSREAQRLINITKKALDLAIKQIKPGNTTGDIGHAVEQYVESQGLSVIRELVGHGVGRSVHEPPQIPNFGRPGTGEKLQPGLTLAIEPMVAMGDWQLKITPGQWPAATKDKSLSAHFEHTVLLTDKGYEILTRP